MFRASLLGGLLWACAACLQPVEEIRPTDAGAGGGGGGAFGGGGGGGGGSGGSGGGSAPTLAPNLMVLLDTSGSMDSPIDLTSRSCPFGCGPGNPCPAACATRMSEARLALRLWVSSYGARSRMGLTTFPAGASCQVPGAVAVDLPPPSTTDDEGVFQARADEVGAAVEAVRPVGGTPTAGALSFVGTVPGLLDPADGRADYVLLLTDGLPNCNEANPNNTCAAPNPACRCTLSSCQQLCAIGCLDEQAALDAVRSLGARGVRVIVVGFGADVSVGEAPRVLGGLAEAGGMARTCPRGTAAECGAGNSCDPSTLRCAVPYYRAANGQELVAALQAISLAIQR